MGLDLSINAFSGGYVAFDRLRAFICEATGGSWPPHSDQTLDPEIWYIDDAFSKSTHPGLWEFLSHSCSAGEISPSLCASLAKDLEELLPAMIKMDSIGQGHIANNGGYVAVVKKLIIGCKAAADMGEPLRFR
jgi:hypothetical protein